MPKSTKSKAKARKPAREIENLQPVHFQLSMEETLELYGIHDMNRHESYGSLHRNVVNMHNVRAKIEALAAGVPRFVPANKKKSSLAKSNVGALPSTVARRIMRKSQANRCSADAIHLLSEETWFAMIKLAQFLHAMLEQNRRSTVQAEDARFVVQHVLGISVR